MPRKRKTKLNYATILITSLMLITGLTIISYNTLNADHRIPFKFGFLKSGVYLMPVLLLPYNHALTKEQNAKQNLESKTQRKVAPNMRFILPYVPSVLLSLILIFSVLVIHTSDAHLLGTAVMAPLISTQIGVDQKQLDSKSAMKQTIINGLRKNVIEPLGDLVKWDRYAIKDDIGGGFLFGWIKRDDGKYDFVVINFQMNNGVLMLGYNTSSKKYSQEILKRLKGNLKSYAECRSAGEIILDEGSLIDWQKEA